MVAGLLPIASSLTASPAGAATAPAVVSYPATFSVVNTDQATVLDHLQASPTVPGDGKTYQVTGHITAPAGALAMPNRSAALYLAGHGYGEWYWNLTQVPAFDYAANQAKAGLISVTVDKIGYGSNKPDGKYVGYGTEATVDHQIMQELRSGQYQMSGHTPVTFNRLALVGGSQSAFSAEEEAVAFGDANGYVEAGFADEGFSPGLVVNYSGNVAACQTTNTVALNGYPPDYAYRETTAAAFNSDDLGAGDTSAAVTQAADSLHSEDPCGYPTFSVGEALPQNNLFGATIKAPILSIMGADDSEFIPSLALAYQQNVEFALNPDHTTELVPNTPQALTLSNTAPVFDADMAKWLCARSFGAYSGSCAAPATTTAAAVTSSGSGAATGISSGATPVASAGSGGSLPVTGSDTLHNLAIAVTLLCLGGTIVGLSATRVVRRRS